MRHEGTDDRRQAKGTSSRWRQRSGGDPRRVGESVQEAARLFGAGGAMELALLRDAWESVVGPVLASHTRPLSLERGVLVVGTDDGAWASELRFHASTVVGRGRRLAPGMDSMVVRVEH